MLGLGSVLTTGSAHEQMYSLLLDGTGDYLATGSAFQSTHRGSFSYSFWMKPDDGQPGAAENLLGCDNADDTDAFFITLDTAGKIKIDHEANNDDASYITNAAVYADGAGDWKHICVTITDGDTGNSSYIIYVDGAAVAGSLTNAVAGSAHDDWTSSDNVYIGATNDNGTALNPFTGKMDEVAIWNVALDADAVTAIYNSGKPFDLNNDRGNYDNSSALVAYWRMFNGTNDDKAGGLVLDQVTPTFGSEIISNSDFSSGATNWTNANGLAEDYSGAGVLITADSGVVSAQYPLFYSDTVTLTDGKIYRVQYDIIEDNDSESLIKNYVTGTGSGDGNYRPHTNSIIVEGKTSVYYFLFDASSNNDDNSMRLQFELFNGDDVTKSVRIGSASLKVVNGNPGVTAAGATFSADTPDD